MTSVRLYLRSRHVPAAVVTTAGVVAALAWLGRTTGNPTTLGLLAVLAGAALTGPGLAGNDIDLDRTAALRWPLWRFIHLGVSCALVIGLVAAVAVSGQQLAPIGQVARDAVGLVGLAGLAAATLGAQRAWIPPVTWSLLSLTVLPRLWPPGDATVPERVVTWMVQPPDAGASTIAAVTLGVLGTLTYAVRGPRR